MDIFRRIFGLPRREEQIPFTPRSELPPEGLSVFTLDQDEEVEENEEFGMPSHNLFGQMDQEIREMERHMKDMWSAFGMGPSLFTDDFRKLFEGFGGMLPPGEGSVPALPAPGPAVAAPEQDAESLRKSVLKPSMVPPSPGQRKDEDLDSRVAKEGLGVILDEADDIAPNKKAVSPFQFKSFSRSVSVQTVRRSDGRDSDGNEVVTITEHPLDGRNPPGLFGGHPDSSFGSHPGSSFGSHPGSSFGGHPGSSFGFSGHFGFPHQGPGTSNPHQPDQQGL
ncbi:hypothetical protein B566_EDAN005267, partial [Ephemera danica]